MNIGKKNQENMIFSDIDGEPEGRYRQNVELIKRKETDSNQIINSVRISTKVEHYIYIY